jgi:ABC-2 type transport system permease protein
VDLWANAKKLRADSLGKETEIAMRDWIDVGVYAKPKSDTVSQDKNGIPLYLAKQPVDSGPLHFSTVVDQRPSRVGIDPLHKLTDRQTRDNTVSVRDRSKRTVTKQAPRAAKP